MPEGTAAVLSALPSCSCGHLQGSLDIEQQCRGFLELSKAATVQLVASIFGDAAFAELFTKMCGTEEWRKGEVTGSILATISDYLNDFERLIEGSFFKR